jgi:hypothetical protein
MDWTNPDTSRRLDDVFVKLLQTEENMLAPEGIRNNQAKSGVKDG